MLCSTLPSADDCFGVEMGFFFVKLNSPINAIAYSIEILCRDFK